MDLTPFTRQAEDAVMRYLFLSTGTFSSSSSASASSNSRSISSTLVGWGSRTSVFISPPLCCHSINLLKAPSGLLESSSYVPSSAT